MFSLKKMSLFVLLSTMFVAAQGYCGCCGCCGCCPSPRPVQTKRVQKGKNLPATKRVAAPRRSCGCTGGCYNCCGCCGCR